MTNVRINKLLNCASGASGVDASLLWEDGGFRRTMFNCDGLEFSAALSLLIAYVSENY